MAKKLLLPKDAREHLLRRYNNQHKAWLLGDGQWPLSIALGIPTEKDVASDVLSVREWVDAWSAWPSPGQVSWISRQWGHLGTQRLPGAIELRNPHEVATVLGHGMRWSTIERRYQQLSGRWPHLAGQPVIGKHFSVLADYLDEDFSRLIRMLDWLERNPKSGLSPRQLPVEGIDTKWLEKRTGVITELFRALQRDESRGDFFAACGLRRPAHRIRLRILCPKLRELIGGLKDIESPFPELASLPMAPRTVLIVENLETGLALPDMEGVVAFMKLGNAVSILSEFPWLHGCNGIYWGDIDTHGYAILNRARAVLPKLVSLLMDEETLTLYRELWVEEPVQCPQQELPLLTAQEMSVFIGLRSGKWGTRPRLEQERIPWPAAMLAITKLPNPPPFCR